jgi:DNA-binding transcriptional ArsR family regulator
MKRDMELVLKILKVLEEREDVSMIKDIKYLELPDYDDRVVHYHLVRMYEAGLIDAEVETSSTTKTRLIRVYPFGLTWQGHEFLDALKNQSVFSKVKEKLSGKLDDISFVLLKELALKFAREQLGLL